jgi:hypothetical protein
MFHVKHEGRDGASLFHVKHEIQEELPWKIPRNALDNA